jgi:hypothetical protein
MSLKINYNNEVSFMQYMILNRTFKIIMVLCASVKNCTAGATV